MSNLSWLNPTPHAIAVYASQPPSPVAPQHSLPSGRYSLLGPDLHRQDRTSFAWRTHGIYLATTAEQPTSRVYNIGTGVGVTLNDFARVIRKHLPRAKIEIGPGLNFLGMPYPASGIYDISRARAELGYAPQFDLERGIADYLETLKRLKM
jgi:hypothetical protein